MTKLVYPINGVYGSVSGSISRCNQNLSNAVNSCSFSIPSGFAYTNYVNGLSAEVSNFLKELNDIKSKIQETDSRYSNLEEGLSKNVKSVPASIISDRDRLIK